MGYLCLKCFEEYTGKANRCPRRYCGGELVEIDELMMPLIIWFNKHGMKTKFCCSGHANKKYTDSYIMFENYDDMNKIADFFSDLPQCWEFKQQHSIADNLLHPYIGIADYYRANVDYLTDLEIYRKVLFGMASLYSWAIKKDELMNTKKQV
jgi:hypothetical protein